MVKCADCGFLATRNVDSRELVEMEGNFSDTGECPQRKDFSPHYSVYDVPKFTIFTISSTIQMCSLIPAAIIVILG